MRNLAVLFFLGQICVGTAGFALAPPAPVCELTPQTFTNDTAAAISDSMVATSSIVVTGMPNYLWDLDLKTFITHSFNDDLDITLTSPSGTIVTVSSDNGANLDNVFNGTLWDDSADPGTDVPFDNNSDVQLVTATEYTDNLVRTSLVPEEGFSTLIGEDPNGIWTLRISDDGASDSGSLDSWSLNLTTFDNSLLGIGLAVTNQNNTAQSIPDASGFISSDIPISGISGGICDVLVTTNITHTFTGDLQIALRSPAGTEAIISSLNGGSADNVFAGTVWDSKNSDPGNQVPFPGNNFSLSGLVTDTTYASGVAKIRLAPQESFGVFDGEDPVGTWTLKIADRSTGDTGTLNSWSIEIVTCLETDDDGDGVGNTCDECPSDSNKSTAGFCGCGNPETDSDGDSTPDCVDGCPANPDLTASDVCGCTTPTDSNGNGIVDCMIVPESVARIGAAKKLAKKIKLEKKNSQKNLRKQLKALVNSDIVGFLKLNLTDTDVLKLTTKVKSAAKKFLKLNSTFSADKAAFNKALNKLSKALAAA